MALSALPERFDAGTTVIYTKSFADYPASAGWAASLFVAGAASFTVTGAPSGASFVYTIPASKTATVGITNGTTTNGSKTVGRAAGDFAADGVQEGYRVYGPGIPSGAYVTAVGTTSLAISEEATATGASLALKFLFPDGTYQWRERVTKAAEAYVADSGMVDIAIDLNGAPAGAMQSWAARMLLLVEDIIAGRIASDTESYAVANRSKVATRMETWLGFRNYLLAQVASARSPGTLQVVRAKFTGTTAET